MEKETKNNVENGKKETRVPKLAQHQIKSINRNKFKDWIVKTLFGQSLGKSLVLCLFMAAAICVIFFIWRDTFDTMVSTFLGMMCTLLVSSLVYSIGHVKEDYRKVCRNLHNYYKDEDCGANNYVHYLIHQGKKYSILYRPRFCVDSPEEDPEIIIDDRNDEYYQPSDFIMENYDELLTAHRGSSMRNDNTVRLHSFDTGVNEKNGKPTLTLNLQRSTFFNHLVTNRAVDFRLNNITTLRELFEYGPKLNDFSQSQFSNHIGINAIVVLKDGRVPIPRRNMASTTSKNCFTSSIATRLKPIGANDHRATEKTQKIPDRKTFEELAVFESLKSRLHFTEKKLREKGKDIQIVFLGFGQDLYEGGKPQFYYAVYVKSMDSAEYLNMLKEECPSKAKYGGIVTKEHRAALKSKKEDAKKEKKAARLDSRPRIDQDKLIYVCKDISFHNLINGKMKLSFINRYKQVKKTKSAHEIINEKKLIPERSFYCNLWHLLRYEQSCGKVTTAFNSISVCKNECENTETNDKDNLPIAQ